MGGVSDVFRSCGFLGSSAAEVQKACGKEQQSRTGLRRLEGASLRAGPGGDDRSGTFVYTGTVVTVPLPTGGVLTVPHGNQSLAGDNDGGNVAVFPNGDEFRGSFIRGKRWGSFGAFRHFGFDGSRYFNCSARIRQS